MKKIVVVLFLLCLFYGKLTYVDLSKYGSAIKTIEVKGEVNNPGVYEVDRHAIVKEVLKVAGGLKDNADITSLNLTQDIANHSVIVIKEKSEQKLISINSASLEELDSLPGIGPSVASRVIEYRTSHPFKTIEELKNVKGIGDKMFAKLKDLITL